MKMVFPNIAYKNKANIPEGKVPGLTYFYVRETDDYLNKLGYCYTTRVYKEIGKYKVGELYTAPWGDVLKIDEVKTYWKVSDRPFYDEMNDDEKIEIRKFSEDIGLPYEFIKYSKSTV